MRNIFVCLCASILMSFNFLHHEPSPKTEKISDWDARFELAKVLSYLKKYDESIIEFNKLILEKPDSNAAKIELAKVFFFQGDAEKALNEFSKVPIEKIDDSGLLVLADVNRQLKRYSEAENIYSDYLKRIPQDDKIRLKLAELLSWQKRYQESVAQYQIILSHLPDDIQVRRQYAQTLTWMGEEEAAVEEWRKTLK